MQDYILKIDKLDKSYNGTKVLNDINIKLKPAKIYGLIGKNGAGKTTLMRIIAGHSYQDSGNIELFGQSSNSDMNLERKRLGCLIEHPGLIASMTAMENLRYHRILKGIPNTEIESELLQLVGLSDTGSKKAKNFSLGMKQRLGIAIALLGNPEMIILDEPINGLDPVGVVEIRRLLARLCDERQMTILISSHNLPELYQLATDYIIINNGSIINSLTLEQLDENCRHHILIKCDQVEKLVSILETKLSTTNYKVMPDKSVKLYDFLDKKQLVAETLVANGVIATEFAIQGDTLENYFISLVGGEANA